MKFTRLPFTIIKGFRRSLVHLDTFYRNIVSECPVSARISYCQSLIYRTREDLAKSKCAVQKRKLKKLLRAAKVEMLKLMDDTKESLKKNDSPRLTSRSSTKLN